ncbi:uncharacterized protein [Panulirus ornatus]
MKRTPSCPWPSPTTCLALPLLLLLLVVVAADGAGGAENSAAAASPTTTITTTAATATATSSSSGGGRHEEWAAVEGEVDVTTPQDTCPEDLCKVTQLTDGGGGVLAAEPLAGAVDLSGRASDVRVKVVCHDHLRITSLKDIWPHCLPPSTRILDVSASGLTRIPAGVLSHLPRLEKL